jgi:L-malate glycosyltransferase
MVKVLINAVTIDIIRGGGLDVYIYNLAKTLLARNHEVHIIAAENNIHMQELVNKGARLHLIPQKLNTHGIFIYFIKSTYKTLKLIQNDNIDILHAHCIMPGLSSAIASTITQSPFVVTFHGGDIGSIKWKFKKLLRKIVAIRSDKLILLNKDQIEEFTRSGIDKSKMALIHTGVDITEFKANFRSSDARNNFHIMDDEKIILSISTLNKRKNIKLLLESFSLLPKDKPYKLLIAGDGPERSGLESYSKKLNIADRTIFTGLISSRRNVVDLMLCSDVFVLSSLVEGLPLTILEAMASKTPVISTRVGGVPEVIINGINGILVGYDSKEMAIGIEKILGDPNFMQQLIINAFDIIKDEYTWDHVCLRNEEIYLNLVNKFQGTQLQ